MKPADYKCSLCSTIRTIEVKDKDEFPQYIPCFKCNEVTAKRKYTPIPSIIHQGKTGNYKNGYTSSPVPIKKT